MYFLGKGGAPPQFVLPVAYSTRLHCRHLYNVFPKKPKKQDRAIFVAIVGIDLIRFSFLSLSRRVTKPTLLLPSLFSELPLLCGSVARASKSAISLQGRRGRGEGGRVRGRATP